MGKARKVKGYARTLNFKFHAKRSVCTSNTKSFRRVLFVLFFATSFIFVFANCTTDKKSNVTYWIGKTIKEPDSADVIIQGKSNVMQGSDYQYKILSYISPEECLSCTLKFDEWNKYMEHVNLVTNNKVKFVFYVYYGDKKTTLMTLRRYAYNFPIVIDCNDELNQTNQLPKDVKFHTFLLDKHNTVMAVGNPILNSKIMNLFNKIIFKGVKSHK